MTSTNGEEILDIIFGKDGNSYPFLGEGWTIPENGFNWINGKRATLIIPRPALPSDCRLKISLNTYVPADVFGQRLAINLGEVRLAHLVVSKLVDLDIWIPSSAIEDSDDPMLLSFICPDAARPSDHVASRDDRLLAFMVRKLCLSRLPAPAGLNETPLSEIAWSIESLGSNCETGLVQRRCGAEPLGLLRFAQGSLPALVQAVDARFEGIGRPDNLDLILVGPASRREWQVIDRRYGFLFHTLAFEDSVSKDEVLRRETRRIPRLAKKLMADISSAEKLLIFHDDTLTSPQEAIPLLQIIRRQGPSTMLVVMLDQERTGAVEWYTDGLLVGYLDRKAPPGRANEFSWASWSMLLRRAYDLWRQPSHTRQNADPKQEIAMPNNPSQTAGLEPLDPETIAERGEKRTEQADNVSIGRDGWLFHRVDGAFEQICEGKCLSERNLSRLISLWEARLAWCQVRGIEYRILVVPERHVLYPDMLPEGYAPHPERPVLRLLRAADQMLRSNIIYPEHAIRQGRQHHEVCYKKDVHWTRYGAYLGYRELIGSLSEFVGDLIPEASLVRTEGQIAGDMALWLGDRTREVVELFDPPATDTTEVFTNRTFKPGQVDVFETAQEDLPRLVLFRTSHSTHLFPFLMHHFSRVVAIASTAMHHDLLRDEMPDVVISEIAERYLAAPHEPRHEDWIRFPLDFAIESFTDFTRVALPLPKKRARSGFTARPGLRCQGEETAGPRTRSASAEPVA